MHKYFTKSFVFHVAKDNVTMSICLTEAHIISTSTEFVFIFTRSKQTGSIIITLFFRISENFSVHIRLLLYLNFYFSLYELITAAPFQFRESPLNDLPRGKV